MKKKLFVLSILSLIFVVLMFAFMFIPMAEKSNTYDIEGAFSIFNFATYSFFAFTGLNAGAHLYPVVALVFAVFIVIHAIKNIKMSKSEEELKGTRYSVKCLWILFIVALYGWVGAFIDLGTGVGDMVGMTKALVFYLVPVIAIMIVNGKLKKLEIKKEETK